jgi:hypothetical protein
MGSLYLHETSEPPNPDELEAMARDAVSDIVNLRKKRVTKIRVANHRENQKKRNSDGKEHAKREVKASVKEEVKIDVKVEPGSESMSSPAATPAKSQPAPVLITPVKEEPKTSKCLGMKPAPSGAAAPDKAIVSQNTSLKKVPPVLVHYDFVLKKAFKMDNGSRCRPPPTLSPAEQSGNRQPTGSRRPDLKQRHVRGHTLAV